VSLADILSILRHTVEKFLFQVQKFILAEDCLLGKRLLACYTYLMSRVGWALQGPNDALERRRDYINRNINKLYTCAFVSLFTYQYSSCRTAALAERQILRNCRSCGTAALAVLQLLQNCSSYRTAALAELQLLLNCSSCRTRTFHIRASLFERCLQLNHWIILSLGLFY